jgi:hypothetical protein
VPFGLLGARVTSVDITEGQLAGDCTVAAHYGYEISTIRADMRDLSPLYADAFYLVSLAGERIGQYCARPARRCPAAGPTPGKRRSKPRSGKSPLTGPANRRETQSSLAISSRKLSRPAGKGASPLSQ